uniref:B-block binding subunit of TFIIIC domain-containing protein n=1 Tax=Cyclopterus lumpus TaxID=8103 RepID=A0A8C2W8W9_CYCLU
CLYGRKLVVVASQLLRFRTLIGIGSDPDLKLNDDSFCLLERVGRARWQGELQKDLHGGTFKVDARKLHYLRKSLVKHGLVTMQPHVTRVNTGQKQNSILLLLKRFHVNRRTKYDILMEHMSNLLMQSPDQLSTLMTLKEQLSSVNDQTFKRLTQYMRSAKFVELCQCPLEDLDPTAGPCINKKGDKVLVRCLKLLKPYTKKGVTEDDDDDDDEDEDYDHRALPSEGRIMETDTLSQAYQLGKFDSWFDSVSSVRSSSFQGRRKRSSVRSHETYRLLRRRNLIIESVQTFRIIEGLYQLQKIINEEEKNDGINTKCCRKTIFRLVDNLSREGLLKVYKTTIIQDGISKKIEMVVHPSVQPNDNIVSQVIEQARFKISSSYSAVRLQHAEEKAREQAKGAEGGSGSTSKDQKKNKKIEVEEFKPTPVRGLGKSLGFQPKMHRLRLVHNFLWYLIYGHPGRHQSTGLQPSTQTAAGAKCSDPEAKLPKESANEDGQKFIPPLRVHKDFGSGWAMVGDVLLCLPLSIFIQVIQINYEVDGLEEYLNDPVKQHHLIRELPARMKRQLLFKRKYIFSFHEKLQKLAYMGLLQFGPVEKFKDKDQVFVYLMRNASIVDTTSAEPHYWLVTESPDNPFERRRYTFDTTEDVENYWFDLMCVCLNTALGTCTHSQHWQPCEKRTPPMKERLLPLGGREVTEDGSIPGDGKGAGGLHSEFFAHLKRNWLWTNHLLSVKSVSNSVHVHEVQSRSLQNNERGLVIVHIYHLLFMYFRPRVVWGRRRLNSD